MNSGTASIKQLCDDLRSKLKNEASELQRKARETGICPIDGKPIPKQRLSHGSYTCSEDCAMAWYAKYGWTAIEDKVKARRRELKELLPKKELNEWTKPIARKDYRCNVCGLPIPKGEKYDKFTCLPGDEYFVDDPYETIHQHENCSQFVSLLYDHDFLDFEGYDDDELDDIQGDLGRALSMPKDSIREMVRDGKIGENELSKLKEFYKQQEEKPGDD